MILPSNPLYSHPECLSEVLLISLRDQSFNTSFLIEWLSPYPSEYFIEGGALFTLIEWVLLFTHSKGFTERGEWSPSSYGGNGVRWWPEKGWFRSPLAAPFTSGGLVSVGASLSATLTLATSSCTAGNQGVQVLHHVGYDLQVKWRAKTIPSMSFTYFLLVTVATAYDRLPPQSPPSQSEASLSTIFPFGHIPPPPWLCTLYLISCVLLPFNHPCIPDWVIKPFPLSDSVRWFYLILLSLTLSQDEYSNHSVFY